MSTPEIETTTIAEAPSSETAVTETLVLPESSGEGATAPMKRRRPVWLWPLVALLVLALLVGGFLVLRPKEQEQAPAPAPTTTTSTATVIVGKKPLLESFPKAPDVVAGAVTTAVTPTAVTATDGTSLSITGDTLKAPAQPCSTTAPTNFCLAARGAGATKMDVYYLKDAAHSRLFENPTNFTQVTVPGAATAGTMMLDVGAKTAPAIVMVNHNSSGWMVVLPDATEAVAQTMVAKLTTKS